MPQKYERGHVRTEVTSMSDPGMVLGVGNCIIQELCLHRGGFTSPNFYQEFLKTSQIVL